jgi:hypothetical protein
MILMRSLVLLFTLSASLLCGENIDLTGGMANGRAWEKMTVVYRAFYVKGLIDQILWDNVGKDTDRIADRYSAEDYVKELTTLYADRENIRLPIPKAFDYCTKKLQGRFTKQELEQYLISVRELVSTLWP